MRRCVCPGSYDPVTNGHLDVIKRASRLFDQVLVAVLVNPAKQAMFAADDRIEMLRESTSTYGNVSVEAFTGLLVDYCRTQEAPVVVKGLRGSEDVDYELAMAQMNAHLGEVETLFLATYPAHSFVSSTLVRDIAAHGGDVTTLVPEAVSRRLNPRGRK